MANRARRVLGILVMSTLGACSGGEPRTAGGEPRTSGGLDGGGLIALALSWDMGVFVQPIWDQGELRLLVTNRRPQAVSFGVFQAAWPSTGGSMVLDVAPTRGAELVRATLPALSTQALHGSALRGEVQEIWWLEVDDEPLGLMMPQPPLVNSTLPVVSTAPMPHVQVETSFSLLPGTTFQATVTLSEPGELWLRPSSLVSDKVALLTATGASSEDAVVSSTAEGFEVEVPPSTSLDSPARVQLTFALPQGAPPADAMLALDAGYFCFEPVAPDGCNQGTEIMRFVPAP